MSPRYHSRAEGRSARRASRETAWLKNRDRRPSRDGGDRDAPDLLPLDTAPRTPPRAYTPIPDAGTPPTPLLSFSPSPSPPASSPERPLRSPSRKKDTDHVKRPPNAFILFRSEWNTKQRQERGDDAERNHRDISCKAGDLWRCMSNEAKLPYKEEARRQALQHKLDHPDYKYAPQPKKEKRTKLKPKPKPRAPKRAARAKKTLYRSDDSDEDMYDSEDEFDPTYASKTSSRSRKSRLPSLVDHAAQSPAAAGGKCSPNVYHPMVVDSTPITPRESPQGLPLGLADCPGHSEAVLEPTSTFVFSPMTNIDLFASETNMLDEGPDSGIITGPRIYFGDRFQTNQLYTDFLGISSCTQAAIPLPPFMDTYTATSEVIDHDSEFNPHEDELLARYFNLE